MNDGRSTIRCFRFVNEDMTSNNDGKTLWKIGKWKKVRGKIEPCKYGLHASRTPYESIGNIYGTRWFIAEARGTIVEKGDKIAASEMRLVKEIPKIVLQRFAVYCAKDCLQYYKKKYPNYHRVADCIRAAEDFLDGKIGLKDLLKAQVAAYAAADAAAADAAAAAAAYAAADAAADAAAADDAYAAAAAANAAAAAANAADAAAAAAAYAAAANAAADDAYAAAARKRQETEINRLVEEYLHNANYSGETLRAMRESR